MKAKRKLEEIATCYTGAVLKRYEGIEAYPVLSSKFVDDSGEILDTEVFHGFHVPVKYLLQEGDLAMKVAMPNTTVYVPKQWQGTVLSSYHFLIRVKGDAGIDPRFLAAYFNSRYFQQEVERELVFATVKALKISALKKMSVPVLPMSQQKRVIDIIEARRQERLTRRNLQEKMDAYVELKLADIFARG